MHALPSRTLMVTSIGAVLVLAGFGLAWAVMPEAQGGLLLAGYAVAVTVYLVIYAVERRRHW